MKKRLRVDFKKITAGLFPGEAKSHQRKSKGPEFVHFRDFDCGIDCADSLDVEKSWKSGRLVVRDFEAERSFASLLVVDVSSSQSFEAGKSTKNKLALGFIKIITTALVEASSKVGLLLFSNKIETFVVPQYGQKTMKSIFKKVKESFDQKRKRGTNFRKALKYVFKKFTASSMIIIISDGFFGDPEDYKKLLIKLKQKHDVIAIILRDRREKEIPTMRFGEVCIEDIESGEIVRGNRLSEDLRFNKICQENGIVSEIFYSDEAYADLFFKLRSLFERHTKRRGR